MLPREMTKHYNERDMIVEEKKTVLCRRRYVYGGKKNQGSCDVRDMV